MIFTPDNIIENIDKIGPWSCCFLAEIGICHFYADKISEEEKGEYFGLEPARMAELCNDWKGIIIRYQKEVGYTDFPIGYVNEY